MLQQLFGMLQFEKSSEKWPISRIVFWGTPNPSLYNRCWQCAAVDGRKCPEDATLVSSLTHDSCITWRNGNNTVLLQNLVRFSEECTTSKVDFWSKFIDLYYQGMGGMVKCCAVDGCNTGIASPADSNSNRFTQNPNNNIPTRFTQNPINPNPTAPTIQQMNEFISNLPAELPGAPLGSFLQQPFNTNQQPTFLNQQAFISSNPQVSFFKTSF